LRIARLTWLNSSPTGSREAVVTHNVEDNTRQRNLLIVLAVVLLIATWRFVGPRLGFGEGNKVIVPVAAERPAVDSEEPSRPGRAGAEHLGVHPGDRVAVLRMADLDRSLSESTRGRDPWSFVNPPLPHLSPSSTPDAHGPTAEKLLPKIEEPSPHPADFNLRYLGRFGPPDKQIAVFTKGTEIFNQQEGDVIDNQFIVGHIGYEAVEIRFVGFPDVPAKRVGVTRRQGRVRGNPG
jgi:hypothetical protein